MKQQQRQQQRINKLTSQNYTTGLGYSPGSGPPVGSTANYMSSFYGSNTRDLLPYQAYGKKNKWFFGNPVTVTKSQMNVPKLNNGVNLRTFPQLGGLPNEVGSGTLPGGLGGPAGTWIYGGPAPLSYWINFGKSKRRRLRSKKSKRRRRIKKSKRRLRSKSKKSKKSKRRRRRSKRKD
jgi:hypothetical protein